MRIALRSLLPLWVLPLLLCFPPNLAHAATIAPSESLAAIANDIAEPTESKLEPCRPAFVYLGSSTHSEEHSSPDTPHWDHAFIDAGRRGLLRAKAEFRIDPKEYATPDEAHVEEAIHRAAKDGANLIIGLGYATTQPVQHLAPLYPSVNFTVVDGMVPPLYPNVQALTFSDQEGAFLIGVIAAKKTSSNHIAFIGGMDIPLIRNFEEGFTQGAHYVDPTIDVRARYLGKDAHAWSNPKAAHEEAMQAFEDGADIVFAAAGGSGIGALQAAKDAGKYAIGVDSNQNGLFPGYVLTSLVKRMDLAVYRAIQSCQEQSWQAGTKNIGIREGALDYAVDGNNRTLISEGLIDEVADVKEKILNGRIVVKPYSPLN